MNVAPSRFSLFQYSVLALPLAFAGLPLYIHAPDFYTRDLGMSLGIIGIILLVIRLFDAIQDPIIGYISDKHAGRRFSIITSGATMLVSGMGRCSLWATTLHPYGNLVYSFYDFSNNWL